MENRAKQMVEEEEEYRRALYERERELLSGIGPERYLGMVRGGRERAEQYIRRGY